MPRKPNPFIVIEALDAGGSQTQTDWLVRHLKREKYTSLQLHFPQEDRATGRLIYDKFLLNNNAESFSKREQALLYIQDFFSRSEDIAAAQQAKGRHVIVSDRFYTSTVAYQTIGLSGRARADMIKFIERLCLEKTPSLPKPDLVVFLDTPVEVSLQRLKHKPKDFFETRDRLTAIRRSFLRYAKENNWHIISSVTEDGQERTRQDLHKSVWQVVAPMIK